MADKRSGMDRRVNKDRRLGINRRMYQDRRLDDNRNGHNGPERRSIFDRRGYNERRQDKYVFSKSDPILIFISKRNIKHLTMKNSH